MTEFCRSLQNREFITIDLEFLREKTYYAKLCLIQVGAADDAAVIDPLAEGLDLSPFVELLKNPGITKVFHSGRQDIEILYMLTGFIPEPLFDTQIAAMVCGYGDSVSYVYTVRQATQGLANYIISQNGQEKGVAIAHDSRIMSPEFAEEAALCLNANGIRAYVFDSLRPTPELSFTVRELGCVSGIVITASHNPREYNGYKVYWEDGAQITPPHDKNILAAHV